MDTPIGTGYTVQFRFNPEDVRDVIQAMQKWPEEMRQQIVRKGLKKWGQGVVTSAKRFAYARAHNTKRSIIQVTRKYKSGVIWSAIGVNTGYKPKGKETKGRYGDMLPGWRSHFYEVGWTPYAARGEDERLQRAARIASERYSDTGSRRRRAALELTPEEQLRKGKGRAWRRGIRRRTTGKPRRFQLQYMAKAYATNVSKLSPALEAALADFTRKVNRG